MLMPDLQVTSVTMLFFVYNALAFLTQPLVGLWLDRTTMTAFPYLPVATGLLLCGTLLGFGIVTSVLPAPPLLVALLMGLGNSLFHVYGGKFVTEQTGNDAPTLGLFVSTGALGVTLGSLFPSLWLWGTAMVCIGVLTLFFWKKIKDVSDMTISVQPLSIGKGSLLVALVMVLLVVFVRSFFGQLVPELGHGAIFYPILLCLLGFLGKATGGFVACQFGMGRTLSVSLMLAGVCFLLGGRHAVFFLPMVFLLNLSMPVTLYWANGMLNNHVGLAFGLLAAMLVPGHALGMCGADSETLRFLLNPLVATVILELLVLYGLSERRWQVLAMSVVMNVLTNVPLNLFVAHAPICYTSLPWILAFECLVVVVESLLFYLVTRDIRKAVTYGILCNVVSYLAGVLFQSIVFYFNFV